MENEIIELRIVPFVRVETKEKKGKSYSTLVNNLSESEIRKMSVDSKIIEMNSDGKYVLEESSIIFKGSGLRTLLCFIYDELTEEEKEKYFSRSIVIPVIMQKEKEIENKPQKKVRKRSK